MSFGSSKFDWNARPKVRFRRWFLSLGSLAVAGLLSFAAINIDVVHNDYVAGQNAGGE